MDNVVMMAYLIFMCLSQELQESSTLFLTVFRVGAYFFLILQVLKNLSTRWDTLDREFLPVFETVIAIFVGVLNIS
jgi:hypothetical protein